MKPRDFVLLAYRAFDGHMRGKTTLQKRVYFLAVKLKYDLGYGPHYYGPYSSEVSDINDELKSLGYLEESVSNWGVNSCGFEISRYDYELTEDGDRIVERKKDQYPDWWQKISQTAGLMKEADPLSYMELSIAAKAYFILDRERDGSADIETIKTIARKFGWSCTEDDLEKAASFLERVDLISRVNENWRE